MRWKLTLPISGGTSFPVRLLGGRFDPHGAVAWTYEELEDRSFAEIPLAAAVFIEPTKRVAKWNALVASWKAAGSKRRSFIVDNGHDHELVELQPAPPGVLAPGTLKVMPVHDLFRFRGRPYHGVRQRLLAAQNLYLPILKEFEKAFPAGASGALTLAAANAVDALATAIQIITKRPKDWMGFQDEATSGNLGVKAAALGAALQAFGADHPLYAVGVDLSAISFPAAPCATDADAPAPHVEAADQMFHALQRGLRLHYESRAGAARGAATLSADRKVAVQFFFDRLKAVYDASRSLARMSTSSSGEASFQRGVHGAVLEEHLRAEIRAMVFPLVVSSGAIMGAPAKNQIDAIIWDATFADSVVRVGDYVYVPPRAVKGLLEIKGGVGAIGDVAKRLFEVDAVLQALLSIGAGGGTLVDTPPKLGIIVADPGLFDTVLGRGGYSVVSLFQTNSSGELAANVESYEFIRRFVEGVMAYKPPGTA